MRSVAIVLTSPDIDATPIDSMSGFAASKLKTTDPRASAEIGQVTRSARLLLDVHPRTGRDNGRGGEHHEDGENHKMPANARMIIINSVERGSCSRHSPGVQESYPLGRRETRGKR